jgi:hypothetical protein
MLSPSCRPPASLLLGRLMGRLIHPAKNPPARRSECHGGVLSAAGRQAAAILRCLGGFQGDAGRHTMDRFNSQIIGAKPYMDDVNWTIAAVPVPAERRFHVKQQVLSAR